MQNIIDHLSVGVSNLEDAQRFFDPVLSAIGLDRLAVTDRFVAYGVNGPQFIAILPLDKGAATAGNGVHVALVAGSREEVDAFHKEALAAGGECAGAPGEREGFPGDPRAYMAFIRDPFGNKLEAIANGFAG